MTSLQRGRDGSHTIRYVKDGKASEWQCDAVAVCSGLHITPNIPDIEGLSTVPTVMHSSQFRDKSHFGSGKNVVIVGSGETGMDLAYMAVNSDANSVTLCHRDGFLCAPKVYLPFHYFSGTFNLTWI